MEVANQTIAQILFVFFSVLPKEESHQEMLMCALVESNDKQPPWFSLEDLLMSRGVPGGKRSPPQSEPSTNSEFDLISWMLLGCRSDRSRLAGLPAFIRAY